MKRVFAQEGVFVLVKWTYFSSNIHTHWSKVKVSSIKDSMTVCLKVMDHLMTTKCVLALLVVNSIFDHKRFSFCAAFHLRFLVEVLVARNIWSLFFRRDDIQIYFLHLFDFFIAILGYMLKWFWLIHFILFSTHGHSHSFRFFFFDCVIAENFAKLFGAIGLTADNFSLSF